MAATTRDHDGQNYLTTILFKQTVIVCKQSTNAKKETLLNRRPQQA